MFLLLKIIIGVCLFSIFLQDVKERKVYLFLYVFCGCAMGYLFFSGTTPASYITNVIINLSVIGLILFILYLYSTTFLGKPLTESFGTGDILFFIVLSVSFGTTTFLVLLSFSLLFSAILFAAMKSRLKQNTVPLAGYQALFFAIVVILNWSFSFTNFYSL